MKPGGTACGDAVRDSEAFLRELANGMKLTSGKILIYLHEGSISAVKVKPTHTVTFDGCGRPTTPLGTASLNLSAIKKVQDAGFLSQFRAAVGDFGSCMARVDHGRLDYWEFRRRRKPTRLLS